MTSPETGWLLENEAFKSAIRAAHFLLVTTYQECINVDEMPERGWWHVDDLHPGVWNKMTSAERDLYHALRQMHEGNVKP